MPTVISIHSNDTLARLMEEQFSGQNDYLRVIRTPDLMSVNAADQTDIKPARAIIYDREAWDDSAAQIKSLAAECALSPTLIALGEGSADTPACKTIPRPLKLGALLDTIDGALSTTLENIHVSVIACPPYGDIDVSAKMWRPNDGDDVPLTDKEIMLLYTLSNTQSGPVSKSVLYRCVWGFDEELETHTLETHIYRLRQKIEKDPANPRILKTYEDRYALAGHEAGGS